MNEGQKRCKHYFGGELRRKRDHLENQVADGGIVLTWNFKKCVGVNIDWIDLTQVRDRRRALVNVLMC